MRPHAPVSVVFFRCRAPVAAAKMRAAGRPASAGAFEGTWERGLSGFSSIARGGLRGISSAFSPASRTLAALLVISYAAAALALPYAIVAPSGTDDTNWAQRALAPWWFPQPRGVAAGWEKERELHFHDQKWTSAYWRDYFYAIDHPSVTRIVYRAALHAAGIRELVNKPWDGTISNDRNEDLGHILPYRVRTLMRSVNLVFFLATLYLIFFAGKRALGSGGLAFLAALPIAVEPVMSKTQLSIVTYIGDDAILLFMVVLFWFAWLWAKDRGTAGAVVLGAAGGLATATQVNGCLPLLAAVVYYAIYARAWRRVALPTVMMGTAAAVFLALNPVYLGGAAWMARALRDTMSLRTYIRGQQPCGPGDFTRVETILAAVPHIYFYLAVAAVAFAARRTSWFGVTAFWSASVFFGNLALIHKAVPRYAAPIRVALLVLFMTAGLTALGDAWRARPARGPATSAACREGDGGTVREGAE